MAQFPPQSQTLMRKGMSPFAAEVQQLPGHGKFQLHHITPIHEGGGVYDLDNLAVVTPVYHDEILDPAYHYDR